MGNNSPAQDEQPDDHSLPSERRVVERLRSGRVGDNTVRIARPRIEGFTRLGKGRLEANLTLEEPRDPIGRLRRFLLGSPIQSQHEQHERITKKKALAVFSSDALSSVAYAPQETLLVLLAAGAAGLAFSLPIAFAVVTLLAIVVTSYRQTIYAYPNGGGSYIVAHTNLGATPGLIAASALIVGYILTVSVSISSAIDQLIAAAPVLGGLRVPMGVLTIGLVTLANLRGLRESASIFAVPTYIFLISMFSLIGVGFVRAFTGTLEVADHAALPEVIQPVSLFLILRAFAVGSAVMTGTEAISDGVQAFKPPEPQNAARTLVTMAIILSTMFLGLSVLIVLAGIVPGHGETVVSMLARGVFGDGPIYYIVQSSTVLILVLAANTAYADFPRLLSFLARDDYAPHQFSFRGERLAFSNGILVLGGMSALLVIFFGGSTGALLPLYALSVFSAFALSQSGMVRHWLREKGQRWRLKIAINGTGAAVTGLVALIAAITNFMNPNLPIIPGIPVGWGAWLVLVIVPVLLYLFRSTARHYHEVDDMTTLPIEPPPVDPATGTPIDLTLDQRPLRNLVVVPIARLNRPTLEALRYAKAISKNVVAVHVASDAARAAEIETGWSQWGQGVLLQMIESPYRSLTRPLVQYLAEIKRVDRADIVTVVLPEYVPNQWWEHLLHGQSAQFLKLLLLFTPGFVVTSVPFHESHHLPARTPVEKANEAAPTGGSAI